MFLNFMTFHFSVLDNFWLILILIFWGGKNVRIWKVTPVTTYDTQFLSKNLFVLSKLGCLQETRAQYPHFWSSYSNFKFERNNYFFSWKYFLRKKMSIIQSIFKFWSKFLRVRSACAHANNIVKYKSGLLSPDPPNQ